MSIENIAQKSAADFMQIDETKIPASYDGQPGKCYILDVISDIYFGN